MRLSKSVKTILNRLDDEKREEARIRLKAYPLRITQKASIPDVEKEKLWSRKAVLDEIYEKWMIGLERRWGKMKKPVDFATGSWSEYATHFMKTSKGLAGDATLWDEILKLDHGLPSNLRAIHKCNKVWWGTDDVRYDIDCTILLAQAILHFWWAKANGNKAFLLNEPMLFPIMDIKLGHGPHFPAIDENFRPEDRHVIVADERRELYMLTESGDVHAVVLM